MPWKGPDPDGDQFPTLGHLVVEWIEENLVIPDGPRRGEPFILTDEQYCGSCEPPTPCGPDEVCRNGVCTPRTSL